MPLAVIQDPAAPFRTSDNGRVLKNPLSPNVAPKLQPPPGGPRPEIVPPLHQHQYVPRPTEDSGTGSAERPSGFPESLLEVFFTLNAKGTVR